MVGAQLVSAPRPYLKEDYRGIFLASGNEPLIHRLPSKQRRSPHHFVSSLERLLKSLVLLGACILL
jgi:hypothetical protein